jgi:uncharacterized phage protein (TIGR01671 family)
MENKRIIKFRAWYPFQQGGGKMLGHRRIDIHVDGQMNKILLSGIKGNHHDVYVHCENASLMQFTGLHDKNGKEIYEGDIVAVSFPESNVNNIYEIKFFLTTCSFGLKSKSYHSTGLLNIEEYYEVIGNIYENPELLK